MVFRKMISSWGFSSSHVTLLNELAFWVLIGHLLLYEKWNYFLELNNL
jgi:hypothetical protein